MQVDLKGNWRDFFNSGLPAHLEAVGTIHTPSRDGALVRHTRTGRYYIHTIEKGYDLLDQRGVRAAVELVRGY